jgi:hypothetical protein
MKDCEICGATTIGATYLLYDETGNVPTAIICKSCMERLLHTNRAVMDTTYFWQMTLNAQYRSLVELFGLKVLKVDILYDQTQ